MTLLTKIRETLDILKKLEVVLGRIDKLTERMAEKESLLARYLMTATRESEAKRLEIEAKMKRDEESSPSEWDKRY